MNPSFFITLFFLNEIKSVTVNSQSDFYPFQHHLQSESAVLFKTHKAQFIVPVRSMNSKIQLNI